MKKERPLDKILKSIAGFSAKRPWLVILLSLIITVIFAWTIETNLKMEPNWIDLAPKYDPSIQELTSITSNFGSANTILIGIENQDKDKLKKISYEIGTDLKNMTNFFRRVDITMDKEFFSKHAFMMEKASQLTQAKDTLNNFDLVPYLKNMNDNFEKTYIGGESDLDKDELRVVNSLNSLIELIDGMNQSYEQKNLRSWSKQWAEDSIEDLYFQFSADRGMVIISVLPIQSIDDLEAIMEFVPELNREIDLIKEKYPGTHIRMTGMHIVAHDEMATMEKDSSFLTVLAFVIILIAFVVVFRMWGAPFLAMLSLSMGIIWDLGITALTIGRLNMITSMTAVILIGLGVDYFVHIVSGFNEGKKEGMSTHDACVFSMEKVGTGVFIGALTTAFAFLMLAFSKMQMFKELGIVLSIGIISTMMVSFLILPAFLSIFYKDEKKEKKTWQKVVLISLAVVTVLPGILILVQKLAGRIIKRTQGEASPLFRKWGEQTTRRPVPILITMGVLSLIFGVLMFFNKMDSNLMNLEDQSLDSIILQKEIVKRFGLSETALQFTTTNLAHSQVLKAKIESNKTVRMVNSLAAYVPSLEEQQSRQPVLRDLQTIIRAYTPGSTVNAIELSNQVARLGLNLKELSQMATLGGQKLLESRLEAVLSNGGTWEQISSRLYRNLSQRDSIPLRTFQSEFGSIMKKNYLNMASPDLVTLQDLPASLLDTYTSDKGDLYLNYVYSKSDIWENTMNSPFILGVRNIVPKATGMPIMIEVLIREGGRQGRIAMAFSLLAIVILLLLDFRDIRYTLLALVPLVLGVIWMLGILPLTTRSMDIMMMMILPLIIGIGIDDGVHILHRYRKEGDNMPKILGTTGNALFMTTFTTMIGFGSLMFSGMEGLKSMGMILFIGIGACYLITVSVLPSILHLMERKKEHR